VGVHPGDVEDLVAALHAGAQDVLVEHVAADDARPAAREPASGLGRAGERDDLVAPLHEPGDERPADEAAPAGDEAPAHRGTVTGCSCGAGTAAGEPGANGRVKRCTPGRGASGAGGKRRLRGAGGVVTAPDSGEELAHALHHLGAVLVLRGWIGAPKRISTGWRRGSRRPPRRRIQRRPGGIAWWVPAMWIGTIGSPCSAASTGAPRAQAAHAAVARAGPLREDEQAPAPGDEPVQVPARVGPQARRRSAASGPC
jgi:hypothetical protein